LAVVSTPTDERLDLRYWLYYQLASDKARKQNAAFHGKPPKHLNPLFRQKALVTTRSEKCPDG
ncbi:MAG: hypothetical protein K2F95_01230, partial [Alistipes sp.]|nr:hypothetical protein [Alistipes sp.]